MKVSPSRPPGAATLNAARVAEPEQYNSRNDEAFVTGDEITTVDNVHNPTVEVHLVGGQGC